MSDPTSAPDLSRLRIRRDEPPATGGSRRAMVWLALVIVLGAAAAAFLTLRPRTIEVRTASATVTGGGAVTGQGISANGYVVARTKASVSAKIAGQLTYLGVHEGSRVRKGEVLARIESSAYAAAVEAAKAQVARNEVELAQSRRDLERARSLAAENVLSKTDLENAQTKVDGAEAQLAAAKAQLKMSLADLENTYVRAPFDGTVLRKDAEVGEIVVPAAAGGGLTRTAIVTMADLATLEVEVDVNEAYIAQIGGVQPCAITLDAYPDTSFRGQVRQVVPTADRQKATVLVKVSILDRDPRILPEMGAKVVFLRHEGAAQAAAPARVSVPKAALVSGEGGSSVWVVDSGFARRHSVEAGNERGDQVEIRSGLSGGEIVVVSPPPALKDGAHVRAAGSKGE